MKKNKRLSDVGLGQEEINKLITKLGVDKNEKKKEEPEETKDGRTKNMTNSGVMVFGGKNSMDHSQENGSVSPLKNSAVMQNYDATMSPMKVCLNSLNWEISNYWGFFFRTSKTKPCRISRSRARLGLCLEIHRKQIKMSTLQ